MSNQDKVSVSVRMPADLYNAIKILAIAENRSINGQVVFALRDWLELRSEYEKDLDEMADRIVRKLQGVDRANWHDSSHPYFIHGGVSVSPSASVASVTSGVSPSISPSASPSPAPDEDGFWR